MTPRKTEVEACVLAAMEPIMAIEGREMSEGDKELLVDLIRDVLAQLLFDPAYRSGRRCWCASTVLAAPTD